MRNNSDVATKAATQLLAEADYEGFVRHTWLAAVRLASLLLNESSVAEDVAQDAFVGVYQRWNTMCDLHGAQAYLTRCVVNGCRSYQRRRRVASRLLPRMYAPPTAATEELALASDEITVALQELRRLPARQREVLVLRYWSDLSEAQIAKTLGVSQGTVKSSASRGIRTLKLRLGGDHGS